MGKVKPEEPLDPRPRLFECWGDGLLELIARDRAGEFVLYWIERGQSNAHYVCKVYYKNPWNPQQNLNL